MMKTRFGWQGDGDDSQDEDDDGSGAAVDDDNNNDDQMAITKPLPKLCSLAFNRCMIMMWFLTSLCPFQLLPALF